MNFQIILPERSADNISNDLRYLTEVIIKNNLGENFNGLLGGEFGYGTKYENDTFFIHPCCQGFCEEDKYGNPTCKSCKRNANFIYKKNGFKIKWYKWIGRSMEYEKINKEEWNKIFNECIISLEDKK